MTARRHYFNTADSLAYEPWTNDQLACLIRLMALLNTRWARNGLTAEEACRAELGPAEVMQISGKRRRDVAVKSLRCLADITSMSVELRGEVVSIYWPKYSEFQKYKSENGTAFVRKASPPHPPPHPHPQPPPHIPPAPPNGGAPPPVISEPPELPDGDDLDRAWGTPSPPSLAGNAKGANGAKRPRKVKTLMPDPLDAIDIARLEDWAADPEKSNRRVYSPDEVQHAIESVRGWSHARGEERADWVAAVQNAMRRGWALEGFERPRVE